ncbi:imelysin family protein [Paracoccus sp. p3-h83]|uniref:imelysin family protein n=1 Tax=Paracoccus sp. p3-h83 TaxID=3342805 RepID=UPI0035BA3D22
MRHPLLPLLLSGLVIATSPALAQTPDDEVTDRAITQVIVPQVQAFAKAATALSRASGDSCDPARLRAPFDQAFDAWMAVQHLDLAPMQTDGRAQAINPWPDPKGRLAPTQDALIEASDPVVTDPAAFAHLPVAARGFPAIERLLLGAPMPEGYRCSLLQATAADLAAQAQAIDTDWTEGFAADLIAPGPDKPFLTQAEVRQALLTQLVIGLDRLGDHRLGRPLGSFHKPRPDRAEAIASGRSLRNIRQALTGLRSLATALAPDAPQTAAAFDRAERLADTLNDPVLAGVATPQGRLRVEILQQAIHAARDAAMSEMASQLGVTLGFNAADGD